MVVACSFALGTLPGFFISCQACFMYQRCLFAGGRLFNIVLILDLLDGWEVPDPDTTTALLATTDPPPSRWVAVEDMKIGQFTTVVVTIVAHHRVTMRDMTVTRYGEGHDGDDFSGKTTDLVLQLYVEPNQITTTCATTVIFNPIATQLVQLQQPQQTRYNATIKPTRIFDIKAIPYRPSFGA